MSVEVGPTVADPLWQTLRADPTTNTDDERGHPTALIYDKVGPKKPMKTITRMRHTASR